MELEAQVAALAARVDELERQVTALGGTAAWPVGDHADQMASAAPPAALPPSPPPTQAPPSLPPTTTPPGPPPGEPEAERPGRGWLTTEALLTWAGIILVVLAAVFFVGTAISRGWIGPELQLAGATAGGLVLMAGAFGLIERRRGWATALATGGAAVLTVCAAAANAGLDLIGEYPALMLLAIVAAALVTVARRLSVQAVAVAAGLAAVFLPLWIVEDVDLPPAVLACWMVGMVVAASAVGWLQGWVAARLLTVIAAALVLLGLLGSEGDRLTTAERLLALLAIVLTAVFAHAGPMLNDRLGRPATTGRWLGLDHRAVLSVPIWTWGAVVLATDLDTDRAVALAGLALTATFVALAVAVRPAVPRSVMAAHLLGAGILLAVSMTVLTDGPALLVGLAAQAAATAIIGWRLQDRLLLIMAVILGVIAVGWAAGSTLDGLDDQLPLGQLLANLFVVALLGATALANRRRADDGLSVSLIVVAWIGVLGWIGSAFGHRPQGQVIVSLLWSALAAAALIQGFRTADRAIRTMGLVTLGVVLVKLLTVDLAEVDTLWRVGLFLVIGAGLLRLGYVLPRLSGQDETGESPPPA